MGLDELEERGYERTANVQGLEIFENGDDRRVYDPYRDAYEDL